MKQNYQALSSVRERLVETGRLPINLQKYLIDSVSKIELGEPIGRAFTDTPINDMPRGKQSIQYRTAKKSRDEKLAMAFSLLNGTNWGRCSQLAGMIGSMTARVKARDFMPETEVERWLFKAFNTGVPLPITIRSINNIIQSNQSN